MWGGLCQAVTEESGNAAIASIFVACPCMGGMHACQYAIYAKLCIFMLTMLSICKVSSVTISVQQYTCGGVPARRHCA